MPVAIAMVAAAAIGAVATVSASNRSANAAKRTAAANNALQRETYDRNAANLQPYISGGNAAFAAWQSFMGLGGATPRVPVQNRPLAPGSAAAAALASATAARATPTPTPSAAPAAAAAAAPVAPTAKGQSNALMGIGDPVPGVAPGLVPGGTPYDLGGNSSNFIPGNALGDGVTQIGVSDTSGGSSSGVGTSPGPASTYPDNPGTTLGGVPTTATPNALSGYDQFRESLGYTTGLEEGMRGLNLRLATGGNLFAGDAGREAIRFNQTYANTFAGDYLDRLMQGSQLGASAAGNLAGVGQNYANASNNNSNTALNARIAANTATGNALANVASTAGTAAGYYYGNQSDASGLASSYGNRSTAGFWG